MILLFPVQLVIDWSLRFGDIVSFLGFALGGLSVIFMMKSDIRALALELGFLKNTVDTQSKEIEGLAKLLTLMGQYEERFSNLRREINELKRGEGWIKKSDREGIDGEYR